MPYLIPHFLLPSLLVAFWRDYKISRKQKEKFPLHYAFIAGIGGVLPDVDVVAYILMAGSGISYQDVHRTLTHSLILPIIFLLLGLAFWKVKWKFMGKHHLKLGLVFLILSFGICTHIALDTFMQGGNVKLLYPFSSQGFGYDLLGNLPEAWSDLVMAIMDATLLFLWLGYLEFRHKISDFI